MASVRRTTLSRATAVRMHLGASGQLHPLARALLDRRGVGGLGDDDIAAEREDLRFVVVHVNHRDLIGAAQRLDRSLLEKVGVDAKRHHRQRRRFWRQPGAGRLALGEAIGKLADIGGRWHVRILFRQPDGSQLGGISPPVRP
jgi:hypothetical protein